MQSHQGINPAGVEEADVFAIHHEGGISCIQVFFFRTGQNWGNRAYFPKADPQLSAAEVLNAFLAQFYDDKPVPKQILLSETVEELELLAAALSEKAGHKVSILVPQRGEKRDLVEHVARQRPRGAWPQARRNGLAVAAARRLQGDVPACPMCRSASRSTTTRTSWAPMPSAAWWSRGRKAS